MGRHCLRIRSRCFCRPIRSNGATITAESFRAPFFKSHRLGGFGPPFHAQLSQAVSTPSVIVSEKEFYLLLYSFQFFGNSKVSVWLPIFMRIDARPALLCRPRFLVLTYLSVSRAERSPPYRSLSLLISRNCCGRIFPSKSNPSRDGPPHVFFPGSVILSGFPRSVWTRLAVHFREPPPFPIRGSSSSRKGVKVPWGLLAFSPCFLCVLLDAPPALVSPSFRHSRDGHPLLLFPGSDA